MTVNKTKEQAIAYLNTLKGYWWDFDLAFGAQCVDLANYYWNYLTGGRLAGYYAKDIPTANNFDGLATVYKNTPNFLPQKGDIVVFHSGYGGGAGHVAIVWSANLNTFVSLDQNWYGGAQSNPREVAQLITHTYDNPMYFIRPYYKATASKVSKAKDKVSKPKATKAKGKKILIVSGHGYSDPGAVGNGTNERDFIRKYIAPNVQKYLKQAGHTVDLYGGSKQDQNLYTDTAYGERIGDNKNYGMYWVHNQKYDVVVELHLDAASASATGGHVIISNHWPADKIDKDINNCLKTTVGTIRG
ncbi:N-acetylmuramoyl-L-alanine amidase, partial [Staphylococcus saprophyticus]|nr:N-acetylmuramoyl-L-alanine amidase [Staphylococcus saprophyticus]